MNNRLGKKCDGFSMTELLVSLGILVVLAALIFPAFKSSKENVLNLKCVNNLRIFGTGVAAYAADHDGSLYPQCPLGAWFWCGDEQNIGLPPFSIYEGATFAQYVGYAQGISQLSQSAKGMLYCPAIDAEHPGPLSPKNIYNLFPNGCIGYAMNREVFYDGAKAVSFSQPSKKILLCDATGVTALEVTYNYPFEKGAFRHSGHANALFIDGHVGSLLPKDVEKSGPDEIPFSNFVSKE